MTQRKKTPTNSPRKPFAGEFFAEPKYFFESCEQRRENNDYMRYFLGRLKNLYTNFE